MLHVACTAFFDKAFLLSESAWRRSLFQTEALQLLVASALSSKASFAELISDMSAALTKAGKLSDKEKAELAARGK